MASQVGHRRFTDELRALSGAAWDAVVSHRFTDELAAGTVADGVLARYLVQDHRFIDSFVVLLASMIAAAPTLADRIPGCQFLALVTGRENTYFERSFEALRVDEETRSVQVTPDAGPTRAFKQLMLETARGGSYAEMLAVLVVAEWTYQSWGERVRPLADAAASASGQELRFTCREWIELHSGEYFGSVVEYLRGLLDTAEGSIGSEERLAVERAFLRAVEIERDFFEDAYSAGST
mmetsp:Transcript_89112/g.252646  ORF Transcript_89112/g.252646 Transcript_89112/m.252646 type:complete len:237 (+) Transcript_89112:3-713(+)